MTVAKHHTHRFQILTVRPKALRTTGDLSRASPRGVTNTGFDIARAVGLNPRGPILLPPGLGERWFHQK